MTVTSARGRLTVALQRVLLGKDPERVGRKSKLDYQTWGTPSLAATFHHFSYV